MSAEDEPVSIETARQRLRNHQLISGPAEQKPKNITPHILAANERAQRLRPDLWSLASDGTESVRDPIHLYRILAARFARKLLSVLRIR